MSTVRRTTASVNKENLGDVNNHGLLLEVESGEEVKPNVARRRMPITRNKINRRGTVRQQRRRRIERNVIVALILGLILGVVLVFVRFFKRSSSAKVPSPTISKTSTISTLLTRSNAKIAPDPDSKSDPRIAAKLNYQGSGYQREHSDMTFEEQLERQSFTWSNPGHLPLLPFDATSVDPIEEALENANFHQKDSLFRVWLAEDIQPWEEESDDNMLEPSQPLVDYTKHQYQYSKMIMSPDEVPEGQYPFLQPLGELLDEWPQDAIDHPPSPIKEHLMVFDYSDPKQRNAAMKFRDADLPFKVFNVPEITRASELWTDAYVSREFDSKASSLGHKASHGQCQQSSSNYFAFFNAKRWAVNTMGPPPTIDTDFSFALWSKHARFADKVGLPPDATHYYWQAGVPAEERLVPQDKMSMISRDLPSFSSLSGSFFSFAPRQQKGIQCRFGERGVTAATHYDTGRNMIAMITGAKRYIISPPTSCAKLGIVTSRKHPSFRHSMLNFGHIHLLSENLRHLAKDMSDQEREWLTIARDAPSLSTVLKAGEVLYLPSHWFHYITSLQKSAQCNVRAGMGRGSKTFGGLETVDQCMGGEESD